MDTALFSKQNKKFLDSNLKMIFYSRAHTIVGINFVQKFKNAAGEETAKTSIINLVDLAGRSVFQLMSAQVLFRNLRKL